MSLSIDVDKARQAATLLHKAFATSGVLGQTEMPEDIVPRGAERGALDHLLFATLTVSIDYMRDADDLWASSRATFEDPETRYLFQPQMLHETPPRAVAKDMQRHRLSKKPEKDANIWRTVGVSFYKKWAGDPRNLLADCHWDCLTILRRLKSDSHLYNQRPVPDFPYLRGDKIGPLWLRMLRDNVGIAELTNLDKVPIPVDIHIARASLALGAVRGSYQGGLSAVFEMIREAWFEGVRGLETGGRPMIAFDVDEPLWHLSKYGCVKRDKDMGSCPMKDCEARSLCRPGRVWIDVGRGVVEVET
ncbi:MAG: hypothetical protein V1694_01265 [Candidatus Eisenbacteria bacterium]